MSARQKLEAQKGAASNKTLHILDRNYSALGRLLAELSWVGGKIKNYRGGGRGYENVLTAEALQGLDFLPRKEFWGTVLGEAQGTSALQKLCKRSLKQLNTEIEKAEFTLFPGNHYLKPSGKSHARKLPVQPDGLIESASCFAVLEAKGIFTASSFRPEQLSREYVLTLRDAGGRIPILLLILGAEPPVKVKGQGRQSIEDLIKRHLKSVLDRAENHSITLGSARKRIPEVVCWITWGKIYAIVMAQQEAMVCADPSIQHCVDRLARAVTRAIEWHGTRPPKKQPGEGEDLEKPWNEKSFFAAVKNYDKGKVERIRELYKLSKPASNKVTFRSESKAGAMDVYLNKISSRPLYTIFTRKGRLILNFNWMPKKSDSMARSFVKTLNKLPGFDIPPDFLHERIILEFGEWSKSINGFVDAVHAIKAGKFPTPSHKASLAKVRSKYARASNYRVPNAQPVTSKLVATRPKKSSKDQTPAGGHF